MPFAIPRIWREPKNHDSDCYFCSVNLHSFKGKRRSISYPNISSSIAPVSHDACLEVPERAPLSGSCLELNEDVESSTSSESTDWCPDTGEEYHLPSQAELNKLISTLGLGIRKSEMLISQLKRWNIVANDVRVKSQRMR